MTGAAGKQTEALATLGGVMTDLTQISSKLSGRPDQAEPLAQLLDRLAVEITEAAAMLRAELLPSTREDPPPAQP